MNTLGDAFKLARAGLGNEQLRAALITFGFAVAVGVGAVFIALVHTGARPSAFSFGVWAVILAFLAWGIVRLRRFTISEARRIIAECAICPRCYYPRVPQSSTCPECGLEGARAAEAPNDAGTTTP